MSALKRKTLKKITYPPIRGNVVVRAFERDGTPEVAIYGDPTGLRSFAALLLAEADLDQNAIPDMNLPPSEGHHLHVTPKAGLNAASNDLIIGRLDSKDGCGVSWFSPPIRKKRQCPRTIFEVLGVEYRRRRR